MRIALSCNEYPPLPHGGIGTFVKTLANEYVRLGHDVTVFGTHHTADSFNDGPIRVEMLRDDRRRFGWFFERFALRRYLQQSLAKKRFDIVELVDYSGMLPWPIRGLPVVVRLHMSWTVLWRHFGKPSRPRWMTYCERQTLARHPHWIGCSKFILEETSRVTGLTPVSSRVIYNPFPGQLPAEVKPLAEREKVILFAGQVAKRKGALAVAEAAKIFLPLLPGYRVVFVGGQDEFNGRSAPEAFKHIVGNELAPRLVFTGLVDHATVLDWMRRAQVFLFPSCLEAFGIVVLEAMASGLPVIYSRLHSGTEIIQNNVNGYLVDPASTDEITRRVVDVCRNLPHSQSLADAARKTIADRFTPNICARESLEFYDEILRRK